MSDAFRSESGQPHPAGPGIHLLPPQFGGAAHETARRRRRVPRGLIIGATAAVLVGGAFAAVQTSANLRYDDTAAAYTAAREDAQSALADLEAADAQLAATAASADALLAGNTGALMDAVPLDAIDTAVADAGDVSTTTDEILATELAAVPTKPGWFWELFAGADDLEQAQSDAADVEDEAEAQSAAVETSDAQLSDAGVAVISSASAAAAAFETAHISARNDDVIALRNAASSTVAPTALDDDAVTRFAQLQAAAAKVVESEAAELAEKDGPLRAARLEIEAFARSLAPGVLLEFDWAPIVNGYGDQGSMGGYTTWWWDEPDRSVMLLSNSVAEQWPAARSKALVAHEVGHAISVKCEDMYDSSTQDSIEKWATAWAIGMGFTDDANGVWAYGYPPQSYIDAAYGCR